MPPRPLALLVEATEPGALNLCRGFRQAGHEVTLISRSGRPAAGDAEVARFSRASNVLDLYPPDKPRHARAAYLLNALGHKAARLGLPAPGLLAAWDAVLSRPIQARLARLVGDSGAEAVYGFWGVGSLPEQRALQRAGAPAALVHQFQTYPLGKALQARPRPASPIERRVLGRLDGRIHASPQMEEYLDAALRPVRGVDQVLPEAWGSWMGPRQRLERLGDDDPRGRRHVVHVGVPPSRPGAHDDVGRQLAELARAGLAVHAVEGFAAPGVQAFPRMGLAALMEGQVATFLTRFDAVVLPVNAPPGLQWFAGNFPARFLSAVGAGVPVAVPRGVFGAVQDFVLREGNGVVYDGAADLASKMANDAVLAMARERALALRGEHTLERFLPRYQGFLDRVLDLRAGRAPGAGGAAGAARRP